MRLQGAFRVGEATLSLDVEIPEDGGVVAVTNAPAECLIIPRERLPLIALSLSEEVRQELADRRVVTVADLIGSRGWDLRPRDFSQKADAELKELISTLFAAALMPDDSQDRPAEVLPTIQFPIDEEAELDDTKPSMAVSSSETQVDGSTSSTAGTPAESKPIQDDDPLSVLKIPEQAVRALHARSCSIVGALCGLTKAQLVMTSGITPQDVASIEKALARCGRQLRSRKGN